MNKDYLLIEETGIHIHSGDIVRISAYGEQRYIVKQGWYVLNTARKYGWYFLSISDRSVIPSDIVDLSTVIVINTSDITPESSESTDAINISHSVEPSEDDIPVSNSDTQLIDECKYILIPGTNVRLYDGDIVKISKYPNSKWLVHCGWYINDNVQNFGWYLSNTHSGKTISVDIIDLTTCTLLSSYTQGSVYHSGPELQYTRPFTDADSAMLNRAFITVDTISQRDSLDIRKLANGKIVRVNDVEGTVAYYAWNAKEHIWEDTTLANTIQRLVGTLENPIVLSELPSNVYLIYGQYKISPNDPTMHITFSDILSLVNSEGVQQYIKVIDNRSIGDYIVELGDITLNTTYVTTDYIDKTYATKAYVNEKFDILEMQIQELISTLDDRIRVIAREEDRLYSTDIEKSYIDNLFDD